MISRRILLVGGTTAIAALAGCAQSKFRAYQGPQVTSVVIFKAQRRMYLMHHQQALRALEIELGGDPMGPKQQEGDGRTPEGTYSINRRNPNSNYHLSIGISYPNTFDVAAAEAAGVRPGGDIFIHGTPREARRDDDWTAGCIAVSDREMEDVYAMVPDGTIIHILP